jgi:hypothetical protein
VHRLGHFIESNAMFQHVQSASCIACCTLDPLIRLVVDVNNGFNHNPFLRTPAIKLDLTSAFNKVEMDELGIPSCFGLFYRGFLTDRCFRQQFGNAASKSARESCRSPQGTVLSPWLFLIHMEPLLRFLVPITIQHRIELAMFAMI